MSESQPTTPESTPAPAEATEQTAASESTILNELSPENPSETTPKPEGAPEKYSDWTLPEGYTFDADSRTETETLFKDLNLTQTAGQKLIDFYAKLSKEAAEAPMKQWQDYNSRLQSELKADPEIGGRLNEVKATIAKAIDGLGDPQLAKDFRQQMDYTGAGNSLAFAKVFYKLAKQVTEGQYTAGNGPATAGQNPRGQVRPASLAEAFYGPDGPKGSLKGA